MGLRFVLLFVISALVSGCVDKFETESYSPPTSVISSSAKALILRSEDGQYAGKPYLNSGRMLTDQVEIAVASRLAQATVAQASDVESALAQARSTGVEYVIEPRILHWEDRATEWSGKPDRITIKLAIWDAETGEIVSTSLERASSKWATFGGDHPQDLLPKLLETWATRVF